MNLIFDVHLDLAWNALAYDRDQTLTIAEIRERERSMPGRSRGRNTVSLPEMRDAGIGLCLATVLARTKPTHDRLAELGLVGQTAFHSMKAGAEPARTDLDYACRTACSAIARGQLAYYELLEQQGEVVIVRTRTDMENIWARWEAAAATSNDKPATRMSAQPIGVIISMEGADPIIDPDQAELWWDLGLRTACLAHYGPSAYAMGTGGDGPLTQDGRDLLHQFSKLGMILDLVHTADKAFAEALERFHGPVFVSHGNCRALRAGDRQISDEQIKQIAERNGVVGVVMDAWMLDASFRQGESTESNVTLETVADHIDHICQLTGSCKHVGFGSDLDGGFGTESTPIDLDTIRDLHRLDPILRARGYRSEDIAGIFHHNFLQFFRDNLPTEDEG